MKKSQMFLLVCTNWVSKANSIKDALYTALKIKMVLVFHVWQKKGIWNWNISQTFNLKGAKLVLCLSRVTEQEEVSPVWLTEE